MRTPSRALSIGLFLFIAGFAAQAQDVPPGGRPVFDEANLLMEEKFYNQAAEQWALLVAQDPQNSNYNWKLGQAYINSYNQKNKALPYLQAATDLRGASNGGFNTVGYDPFDPKERNAPVESEYWLGRALHLKGEFDKADAAYRDFLAEAGPKNDLRGPAERGLEETANARALMVAPKTFKISNAGPVINSDHPEFSPVISVDGNALFFTSRRIRPDSSNRSEIDPKAGLPYENIYVSYKDRNGTWQAPEVLNINPPSGHLASVNVSADGQTLIIYRDDQGDGNLYESKLVGELWSEPVKMGSDINTKSWETHGALSGDGNTFYFVSNRPGGLGGRDIYRVVKLPDGSWSKAQNIGAPVNTPYEEDAVFIHPNGRTMYFASTGHNTMGGFDIFTTELQADGSWSKPENIGYPLNTVDDDIFFVTTADGRRGYFSSDKAGGFGEKDIYYVDFPEEMGAEGLAVLKGFIIPAPGQSLSPSTILYVTDKATGEVKSYKPRQRDGVYVAILPPCKEYNLDYRVDDQTVHTEDIFVECESAYQEINKEVYLNPVALSGADSVPAVPSVAPVAPVKGPEDKAVAQTVPKKEPLTDAQRKAQGESHITPDAVYAAEFTKYHGYNAKDIDPSDPEWKALLSKVVELIDKDGKAGITVEASASHVPTRSYSSNEALSNTRMEAALKTLKEAVQATGHSPQALKVESVNYVVQGPKYAGDWRNTEKYGKFQYVKLKVR